MLDWIVTSEAAHLGALLSALTGLLAAVVAAFVALRTVPAEFQKWRNQRRAEDRSKAAADVAASIVDAARALKYLGSPWHADPVDRPLPPRATAETKERLAGPDDTWEWQEAKMRYIEAEIKSLRRALVTALVYLDDDIHAGVSELWGIFAKMRISFDQHVEHLRGKPVSGDVQADTWEEVFGHDVRRRIGELEEDLIERLKAIARLKD